MVPVHPLSGLCIDYFFFKFSINSNIPDVEETVRNLVAEYNDQTVSEERRLQIAFRLSQRSEFVNFLSKKKL